jgi:glycine oxidase
VLRIIHSSAWTSAFRIGEVTLDAAFVGGGVIGLSGAWQAARRGLRVAVVDAHPGRGASWVAAGMIAPTPEAAYGEEPHLALLLTGAARWPDFAEELEAASETPIDFVESRTLVVAADASDRVALEEIQRFQVSLGLDARRLTPGECRSRVPSLSPRLAGGIESPHDHQVDNRLLVGALLAACRRAGVQVIESHVAAIVPSSTPRVGLSDGTLLSAKALVLCAGAWLPGIPGLPAGALPPVRPVKGHILRLQGTREQPLLPATVRALVQGRSSYLVPRRDGSIVVGATVEERGFDESIQVGAVHALLDDARTVVPGIDELHLAETAVGFRPGSPDNAPSVGWTSIANVAVATGHYRNGILLAPITADAIGALLSGEEVPAALKAFAPDRWLDHPQATSEAPEGAHV